ncbi:MAG: hypothetical protein IPO40_23635 [Fibrobacteres bacterium]|nr:hypothetical protein [Fibrobacterota bacterium]
MSSLAIATVLAIKVAFASEGIILLEENQLIVKDFDKVLVEENTISDFGSQRSGGNQYCRFTTACKDGKCEVFDQDGKPTGLSNIPDHLNISCFDNGVYSINGQFYLKSDEFNSQPTHLDGKKNYCPTEEFQCFFDNSGADCINRQSKVIISLSGDFTCLGNVLFRRPSIRYDNQLKPKSKKVFSTFKIKTSGALFVNGRLVHDSVDNCNSDISPSGAVFIQCSESKRFYEDLSVAERDGAILLDRYKDFSVWQTKGRFQEDSIFVELDDSLIFGRSGGSIIFSYNNDKLYCWAMVDGDVKYQKLKCFDVDDNEFKAGGRFSTSTLVGAIKAYRIDKMIILIAPDGSIIESDESNRGFQSDLLLLGGRILKKTGIEFDKNRSGCKISEVKSRFAQSVGQLKVPCSCSDIRQNGGSVYFKCFSPLD